MLKNGLLFGSFNPLHVGHFEVFEKALENFETLHVFTRYTEGVDMVDWETKKKWLERANEENFDGRLRIYKLELRMKDKQYGNLDMVSIFLDCEKTAGVHMDGLCCGEDMQYMVDTLKAALPDREFYLNPRGYRSSSLFREDLDKWKEEFPEYVYRDLKERGY